MARKPIRRRTKFTRRNPAVVGGAVINRRAQPCAEFDIGGNAKPSQGGEQQARPLVGARRTRYPFFGGMARPRASRRWMWSLSNRRTWLRQARFDVEVRNGLLFVCSASTYVVGRRGQVVRHRRHGDHRWRLRRVTCVSRDFGRHQRARRCCVVRRWRLCMLDVRLRRWVATVATARQARQSSAR